MVSVGKLKTGQARYYLDQAESHPSPAHAVPGLFRYAEALGDFVDG